MSHDQVATLVRMANQIAAFFEPMGEARAVPGIARHIKDYWDPRMRATMDDHVRHGGEGLKPHALKALEGLLEKAAV